MEQTPRSAGRGHPRLPFVAGVRCALAGLADVVRTQRHAQVHLVAAVGVVVLAAALGLPRQDWLWLGAAILLVWISEVFNTALEILADRVTLAPDPLIRRCKDAAAGAVLVAVVGAVIVGGVILGPPLGRLW